ncbi:MAG: ClbS/DfsB family four-helix bundle protein [Cardiobacteriaceae bacterium]|nr:ClbS/DfsB family four-helix bundle protein [Cardiobacteriaceae bacterium]
MQTYTDHHALIAAIEQSLNRYLAEFADIAEADKDTRMDDKEKTPSEHLSYQLGWINLLQQWEEDEQAGKQVHTPAEGYRWNQLGALYQHFYNTYGYDSLAAQQAQLRARVAALYCWIETLSDTELFQPEQRAWATTNARWPLWKWIHINTVAPFTNFRRAIRRWKKSLHTAKSL